MEVLARVLHRQPVVWLRALPGSGLGGKQMTFPGCGGPHQAPWRSEKKTGIPKRERVLPPSATQNPYLSFPTFWVSKCTSQCKKTSRWMRGSRVGIASQSLEKTLAGTGLGRGHADTSLYWLASDTTPREKC